MNDPTSRLTKVMKRSLGEAKEVALVVSAASTECRVANVDFLSFGRLLRALRLLCSSRSIRYS